MRSRKVGELILNKLFAIICVVLMVIIFSISLIRIVQSFFIIYFYYDYVVWCGKEEKEKIMEKAGIVNMESNIVTYRNSYKGGEVVSILRDFPTVFTKEIEIAGNDVSEYIKEKDNKFVAMAMCCLPYIIVSVGTYIVYYKKVLPILTEE